MKIRIASTERIAAFRAIQDGIRSAAASNFALAAMIDADSRGAKAQATEDGLPHGQYQRRERLGILVNAGAVFMPAEPALPKNATDEQQADHDAWAAEAEIAISLHAACMKDGITIGLIRSLAKEEKDSNHLPWEMKRLIASRAETTEQDFNFQAAIERLAKQVASTSEKSEASHGAIITQITKALATQS